MSTVSRPGGFVGRRTQLADLEQAMLDTEAGTPRVVLLGGAAGMGKTRLLGQFADRLEDRGTLVLRTSCVEFATEAVPLAPMTAAVRQLLSRMSLPELAASVPAANALPRLLPELRDPTLEPTSVADQADLFAAVLHRLGRQQPVVWLIDDLQWSDTSTRDLLSAFARTVHDTQILLVAAHRASLPQEHPLPATLGELGRLPSVWRADLAPFNRGEVRELLGMLLPEPPSPGRVDQIYQRSGGNPFYVAELADAAAENELPPDLQALLLRPVVALPPGATAVVRATALAGTIEHDALALAAELPEDVLTGAIRAAVSTRLIETVGSAYRIRHALVAEAVAQDMLPVERLRLHQRCAEAVTAIASDPPTPEQTAALAHHWLYAGRPDHALPAYLAAAEHAQIVHAYAEQARLLEQVLKHWRELDDPEAETLTTLPEVCRTAVYAATWAGEYQLVLDLVARGLEAPEMLEAREVQALLHAHRAMALLHLTRDGVQEAIQSALRLLPADPLVDRLTVLDYLAAVHALGGSADLARPLSEEAVQLASAVGDPFLIVRTGSTLGWVLSHVGDHQASLAVLQEAQAVAEASAQDSVQHARLWLNIAFGELALGRYEEAIAAARTGLASKRLSGLDRTMGPALFLVQIPALIATGRLTEAEALTSRGLAHDPAPSLAALLHAHRAEIALLISESDAAAREIYAAHIAVGDPPRSGPPAPWQLTLMRAEAEVALARGDHSAAMAAVGPGVAPDQPGIHHDRWALLISAVRAITRAAGDRRGLELANLRKAAALLSTDTPPTAAMTLQFEAEAGDSATWSAAADAWAACGHLVNAAYCRSMAAQHFFASDRDAARTMLDDALHNAHRAGATSIVDQINQFARASHLVLADSTTGTSSDQLGLTQRELEVLAMVAEGNSNRQIASSLYISPKTVAVHVSNILTKLGVASRGEAAALAHRSGLFE